MLRNLPFFNHLKLTLLIVFINGFLPAVSQAKHNPAGDPNTKISINFSKISLKDALDRISAKASVVIIYSNLKVLATSAVSLNVKSKPLKEVLTDLLSPFPLSYRVIDDKIVITPNAQKSNGANDEKKQPSAIAIKGKVTDASGKALQGATVRLKGEPRMVITDENGEFAFANVSLNAVLQVSYVGYQTREVNIAPDGSYLTIALTNDDSKLDVVTIVSTGYQTLPRERATGSFVLVDSALLNRRTGTNILDRLDGITSGLIFNVNKQDPNSSNISVRGKSTLFANDQPLIILDNFPYEGDINNINPNDIANITVLKDAAAASIWGVRAGNGVIVITTKKGKLNSAPQVSLNANLTVSKRPDLYYTPQLTTADYIGVEKFLFNQGYYYNISDGYSAISPVVAILQANQEGNLSAAQMNSQLDLLSSKDVRSDLNKYIHRTPLNQQYQLSITGGGRVDRYYISAGWDNNAQNLRTNNYSRVTLNANHTYSLLNNRLEWNTGVLLTKSTTTQNSNSFIPTTPYELLKDENGNNLSVIKGLRQTYIYTAGSGKLLDWRYIPLNDNYANENIGLTDYRLSNSLFFKVMSSLKVSAYYLYEKGITEVGQNNSLSSFYTRNLINTYSQIDPATGVLKRVLPTGDIVFNDHSNYNVNTGRLQVDFDRSFKNDHRITALLGYEISNYRSFDNSFTQYGYDPSTAINANQSINFADEYAQFYGYNTGKIPVGIASYGTVDRNRSYYANASYSYKQRYIVSGSARRDESNIFGVSTNQKGVPLWSSGIAWKINQEPFYHWEALPLLSLRATYGYNGNTDKSTTAYLTAVSSGGLVNSFNAPYSVITNPPNPALRWEKVGVTNIGVDFGLKDGLITGSVEYYIKNSTDLIANSSVAPQTGVTLFRGNSANMLTKGIDVTLNARLLQFPLHWDVLVLFNYAKNRVTKYQAVPGTDRDIVMGNYLNPLVGYPLFSVFSFASAGLDDKGNPQGYLNGQLSSDYNSILNSTNSSNLIFHGSATPVYFGSIINNFTYKNLSLSIGIGYKFDYYFRRTSLNYSTLYAGFYQQADFSKRWQQAGDEKHTTVPSMIYPADPGRDQFYTNTNTLVDRADNIRLQDVRLGYAVDKSTLAGLPFKTLQVYVYANNLAILWRANHDGLDPDSPFISPATKSIAFGIKAGF
jgi:TonB-linked SusC/RagA family outer membrane protein